MIVQVGDIILFQIEDDQWTSALYPILAQILYADNYDDIEKKALAYALSLSERGRVVTVWQEIDANKNQYLEVL